MAGIARPTKKTHEQLPNIFGRNLTGGFARDFCTTEPSTSKTRWLPPIAGDSPAKAEDADETAVIL